MYYYDEQLAELQRQVARKKKVEAMLVDLKSQQMELEEKVGELKELKIQEQIDVDQLEGRSLASFWYGVIGKKDEKLSKEREEAYAAAVKYDAAAAELAAVEADIRQRKMELCELQNCEGQYEQKLNEKKEAVRATGNQDAAELVRLEEQIFYIEDQKRELSEAVTAGNHALDIAESVLSSLDSAEGWSTWDLLGGGLIADIAKHDDLDKAQGKIEELQIQLRRFRTELADVTIHADIQVTIDGFLQFADYFFDGLFADWAVMDQIHESQRQMRETREQIAIVLNQLNAMKETAEQEQNRLKEKLEELVLRASV